MKQKRGYSKYVYTLLFLFLAVAVVTITGSCGGGSGGGGGGNGSSGGGGTSLASITVTPANTSFNRGATKQFSATGNYSDGSTQNLTASVSWGSSDTSVATISNIGLAAANSNKSGPTTITATSGSISGSAQLMVSINLPKTGQTTSYATGDDGELQKGVAVAGSRFTVDGTGFCVTDNLTGLMWIRTPDSTLRIWQDAMTYANGFTNFCGYSDWRLPNKKELISLINYGQANTTTWLNTQGFSNVQAGKYWSSSTYAYFTGYAWVVNMNYGSVDAGDRTGTYYVWPVRAGQ